jgi:hypothetical protein
MVWCCCTHIPTVANVCACLGRCREQSDESIEIWYEEAEGRHCVRRKSSSWKRVFQSFDPIILSLDRYGPKSSWRSRVGANVFIYRYNVQKVSQWIEYRNSIGRVFFPELFIVPVFSIIEFFVFWPSKYILMSLWLARNRDQTLAHDPRSYDQSL